MRCASTRSSPDRSARAARRRAAAVALALSLGPGIASAGSGFAVRTQSATTLGMAQAGMATGAGDVSTMIYNPATLAATTGRSVIFGGALVGVTGAFDGPTGSTLVGAPIGGGDGSGEGRLGLLPSFHAGVDLADGLRAGLSVTSLYGLGSYYADGWVGRYHVIDSEILSVVAQPTLSWRPVEGLAFGAGVQVQYTRTRTSAAIDFGTIDVALNGGALGGVPAGSDGFTEAELDDVSVALTLGVLLEPWSGGRIGLSWRSPMTHDLSGDATFQPGGPVGALISAGTGAFRNTGASAKLRLPASVHVGLQQAATEDVVVYADVNWMGWSRIGTLTLEFDNPAQPDVPTRFGWEDSLFVALGASWEVTETVTLRAGFAWDQSAARGGNALPAVPEGESYWFTAGLGWKLTESLRLDAAAGATFTKDVRVSKGLADPGGALRGSFDGAFRDGAAFYGALQLSYGF